MIDQDDIDRIKETCDLKALAESRGITLKKNGKGYVGLCPFHDDHEPSLCITPSTNQWHCFGCGAGGDVIRFVELHDRVGFPEAVQRLTGTAAAGLRPRPPKPATVPDRPLSSRQIRLLERVITLYCTAFGRNARGGAYLASRGFTDTDVLAGCRVGFADGTLLSVLPDDPGLLAELKAIGILTAIGTELFHECVTFPLPGPDGRPCGLYGRRITERTPHHLYLPGPRRGVFNGVSIQGRSEVILTESILDSLTLIQAGIRNTIPCYGTNGLTRDHRDLFDRCRPETILICFDGDAAGARGAEAVQKTLEKDGHRTRLIQLPDCQDINEFFHLTADPSERFKTLIGREVPSGPPGGDRVTRTDWGLALSLEDRRYEVRGISRKDGRLRATIKAIASDGGLHVDTADLYSARSRSHLVKDLCSLFGRDEACVGQDVTRLLTEADGLRPAEAEQNPEPVMTDQARDEALAFLKNPDLFDEILRDFETLGYTGEEMNKLLCYVAAVSRKMESPLSVMIQSRSAAGKSFLQDTVLSLMPEEDCVKYTRLTDQALFYTGSQSLKHKILAIEELDGMDGAVYSIRSIQSSRKISIAYTRKDNQSGELRTLVNTVEGPVMVFITTTRTDIDGETASRFVFISIDESEAMTRKVLARQRQSHTLEGMMNRLEADAVRARHQNAGRLLRPLHVFNPYAELLTFTTRTLRARRDHAKYLNLILAVAYLFQYQKTVHTLAHRDQSLEYVNVSLADIDKANAIAGVVLGRTLDELAPPSRALLGLIRQMADAAEGESDAFHFTRREIRSFSSWSDSQVRTHIRQLEDLEYLHSVTGRRGKEYVYELAYNGEGDDGQPFVMGLTDIGQLKEKALEAGIKVDVEG